MSLEGKQILLGVTGSIAAYKAADLCSQLGKLGADVHVILTHAAAQFVGAATFRALTRNTVLQDVFDEPHAKRIAHIDLAQSADLVLVAPASADILAKMAHGFADDMLSTCLLATPSSTPVLVAPAMNTVMWNHPATVANLLTLERRVQIVQPGYGVLACQDVGVGKLADVPENVRAVINLLLPERSLQGKRILITAGATREPLDPVRFLTNRSSGKMGYAIAAEAAQRGAQVTLVTGVTSLEPPPDIVHFLKVETTREMLAACEAHFDLCDVFIAAAAVADYAPETVASQKIKKGEEENTLILRLIKNPDILATLAARKKPQQTVIGFAAETQDLLANAEKKLHAKNLDMIVANDVARPDSGFDSERNQVTFLFRDGRTESYELMSKRMVAANILDTLKHKKASET